MHYSTCVVCGKISPVDPKNTPKCCSKECRVLLRKQSISSSVKICELCGEPFTSSSNTAKYCNRNHYRPCPVCGEPVLVERGKEYEPPKCCSETCSNKLRCQTCQDRYDVDVISQSEEIKKKLLQVTGHKFRKATQEDIDQGKQLYVRESYTRNTQEQIPRELSVASIKSVN